MMETQLLKDPAHSTPNKNYRTSGLKPKFFLIASDAISLHLRFVIPESKRRKTT